MSDIKKIKKVLIIDDSEDFRKLLIKFFEKVCQGASIDAYNPLKGKPPKSFAWDKYDLVILDYDLGNGENGLDWLRLYKTSANFPTTIILTAQGNEETVIKAFRYGAHDYLNKKGLTKSRLIESVNCALEKHGQDAKRTETSPTSVHIYNKENFYQSLENIKKNDIVILIEIDKFQTLRDENGILSADAIANFASEQISKYIVAADVEGESTRTGDSSIAMFIHNYQGDDKGKVICQQLCEIFDKAVFKGKKGPINFSTSIAALAMVNDSAELESILKQGGMACRDARHKTGNSFVTYEIKNDDEVEADERLHTHIKDAFKENRVKPHYQTQVKLSSLDSRFDSIEYYQTRINIIDLDGGLIESREFLPVLENRKILKDMDRWVVNTCIDNIVMTNQSDTGRAGFFISLTEESLADIMFPKWLESVLVDHDISNVEGALVLEINIDDYTKYQKQAIFLIKTLAKKHNILFSLTEVKDPSLLEKCLSKSDFDFVMFIPFSDESNMTDKEIESIVSICKKHSCLSVASKIENNDAMMTVMNCNLDLISGYFLQPPQDTFAEPEKVAIE